MNNTLPTTGLIPLTINSVEQFELSPRKDNIPWNLTGGSVTLLLSDPAGFTLPGLTATIASDGYSASVVWQVPVTSSGLSAAGTWLRAWDVTDASGIRQVTRPIEFTVVGSPQSPVIAGAKLLIQDTFRDVPSTLLGLHVADTGQAWPSNTGSLAFTIGPPGLIYDPGATGDVAVINAGTTRYTVSTTFTFLGNGAIELGVCFRADPNMQGTGNGWIWALDLVKGGLVLSKLTTGTVTQVGSTIAFTPSLFALYTVGAQINGNSIIGLLNGAPMLGATDGYLAANTFVGIDAGDINGNVGGTYLFTNFQVTQP
jgi:hypothetical protein